MESPYSVELNHLHKIGSLSGLAFLIFSLITVALIFLPSMHFLIGLVPTIVSLLVGFFVAMKASVVEQQELYWKINRELDALKSYYTGEERNPDHLD